MKRGMLSPFIIEMIGSMIVVGLMIILFSGFAGPFLQFLTDMENIKSFNKFTSVMSKTCTEGAETTAYISLSAPTKSNTYAIGLFVSDFANKLDLLDECFGEEYYPCTTKVSKGRIKNCLDDSDLCWCLIRVRFKKEYCVNPTHNTITIPRVNPLSSNGEILIDAGTGKAEKWAEQIDKINKWNEKAADELTSNAVEKIVVLQCKSVDELNCRYYAPSGQGGFPVLPSMSHEEKVIVWIDPATKKSGFFGDYIVRKIFFDSMSMQRPIANYGPDYYMEFYSHPSLKAGDFKEDKNNVYSSDCP